jgi:hypothetical protein
MHIFQTIAASIFTVFLSWFFPHQVLPSVNHLTPTPHITPVVSFSPTQSSSSSNNSGDLVYPHAEKVQFLGNVITFVSIDDPNMITIWYQNKIKVMDMHNTAVSKTNSNNNILNVLQASNGQGTIKIEITRADGDIYSSVTITK